MTCPRNEDVSAYIDGAMDARECRDFQRHLETCLACRAQREALLTLQQQLKALPSPALGFDLAAQFDDRLRRSPARAKPSRFRAFGWLPAGLSVVISLALGAWIGGLLIGGAAAAPGVGAARVFDPSPPGGLCAAPEVCRLWKGKP